MWVPVENNLDDKVLNARWARWTTVARRVLGESHEIAIKMLWIHSGVLYMDNRATLDDLRGAVTTLEETGRTVRRVFGGTHPLAKGCEFHLRRLQAALRARETPSRSA